MTDQGIRYITQGNGSSVAGVLIDAVNKWNDRNPDKTVLFLNYAAVDPDFTNDKCSFWHFRFDANSDMKMQALTGFIAKKPAIKKVYLFNQDYQFGKQVSKAANEMLAKKRPDIKIVGDEFVGLGKVKDFAPYVAKIKATGADTIITGNWGNDLTLFVKAAREAGLKTDFYTYYAGGLGTPAALGAAAEGKVKQITEWHMNIPGTKVEALAMKPVLLLFDEITSALDPELTSEVVRVLERLAAKGQTMILVTHEIGFARCAASKLIFMHQGKLWEQGRPDDLFEDPMTKELAAFLSVVQRD